MYLRNKRRLGSGSVSDIAARMAVTLDPRLLPDQHNKVGKLTLKNKLHIAFFGKKTRNSQVQYKQTRTHDHLSVDSFLRLLIVSPKKNSESLVTTVVFGGFIIEENLGFLLSCLCVIRSFPHPTSVKLKWSL